MSKLSKVAGIISLINYIAFFLFAGAATLTGIQLAGDAADGTLYSWGALFGAIGGVFLVIIGIAGLIIGLVLIISSIPLFKQSARAKAREEKHAGMRGLMRGGFFNRWTRNPRINFIVFSTVAILSMSALAVLEFAAGPGLTDTNTFRIIAEGIIVLVGIAVNIMLIVDMIMGLSNRESKVRDIPQTGTEIKVETTGTVVNKNDLPVNPTTHSDPTKPSEL